MFDLKSRLDNLQKFEFDFTGGCFGESKSSKQMRKEKRIEIGMRIFEKVKGAQYKAKKFKVVREYSDNKLLKDIKLSSLDILSNNDIVEKAKVDLIKKGCSIQGGQFSINRSKSLINFYISIMANLQHCKELDDLTSEKMQREITLFMSKEKNLKYSIDLNVKNIFKAYNEEALRSDFGRDPEYAKCYLDSCVVSESGIDLDEAEEIYNIFLEYKSVREQKERSIQRKLKQK